METETVTVAGVLPEVGDTESQLPPNGVVAPAEAVKEALPPLLPRVKDCEAIDPPCKPLNARLVGVTVRDVAALTVSVTVTVWLANPGAEKRMVPV